MALKLILYLASIIFFSGCFYPPYYQSSSNANTNYYRTIPLKSDSVKAASYISGILTKGTASSSSSDDIMAFHGDFHRSFRFGICQGYYGIHYSSGFYRVAKVQYRRFNVDESVINKMAGNKFFGSYGVNGGINLVTLINTSAEWRILGLEATLQNEFGDYLKFRKSLPIDAANDITKRSLYVTTGLNSDIVIKTRTGSFGCKIAIGAALRQTLYVTYRKDTSFREPVYAGFTLHYTNKRWTGFLQGNSGAFTRNVQLGTNYRLSKRKRLFER